MKNPFYYLYIYFDRYIFGFCPECNSSAPKLYNCPICHGDKTSPFNNKKRKYYWLRWRVLHGFTHKHYTKEEWIYLIENQLGIPMEFRYNNIKPKILYYTSDDIQWAFEQGIHEGKLREYYKNKPNEFIESDLNYYIENYSKNKCH